MDRIDPKLEKRIRNIVGGHVANILTGGMMIGAGVSISAMSIVDADLIFIGIGIVMALLGCVVAFKDANAIIDSTVAFFDFMSMQEERLNRIIKSEEVDENGEE